MKPSKELAFQRKLVAHLLARDSAPAELIARAEARLAQLETAKCPPAK